MYKISGESLNEHPQIRIFLTKFKEKEIRAPLRTLGLVGVVLQNFLKKQVKSRVYRQLTICVYK